MILALILIAGASQPQKLVAVLPLAVRANAMDAAARETLEEAIRNLAGDTLTPQGYTVLTGDNTLRLLADNGIDPTKACEANCALEAAREMRAEVFVSGTVSKVEDEYVLFVRLFEQASGKQLGSVQLEASTVKMLRAALREKGAGLFRGSASRPAAQQAAPSQPSAETPRPTRSPWQLLYGTMVENSEGTLLLGTNAAPKEYSEVGIEHRDEIAPSLEFSVKGARLSADADRPLDLCFLGGCFGVAPASHSYYFWGTDQSFSGWHRSDAITNGVNAVRIRQRGREIRANEQFVAAFTLKADPKRGHITLRAKGAPGQVSRIEYSNFKLATPAP